MIGGCGVTHLGKVRCTVCYNASLFCPRLCGGYVYAEPLGSTLCLPTHCSYLTSARLIYYHLGVTSLLSSCAHFTACWLLLPPTIRSDTHTPFTPPSHHYTTSAAFPPFKRPAAPRPSPLLHEGLHSIRPRRPRRNAQV